MPNALLGQISCIAGLLRQSMGSLVRFDGDLLIVDDQHVVILRIEPTSPPSDTLRCDAQYRVPAL